MEFQFGDLVNVKGDGKKIGIVVKVDAVKKRYQLQLDNKGEQLEWVNASEVY